MEVPECFGYYGNGAAEFSPEKKHAEQFAVDDLLDFSNEDAIMSDDFFDNVGASSADSSAVTVVDSCNSSVSGSDNQFSGSFASRSLGDAKFSGELCVPYDDLAELEWLSNFVEDSFSTKHNLQQPVAVVSGTKPPTPASSGTQDHLDASVKPAATHHPIFLHETPLPSKSRSKRSRAAPCDWTTRLLHLSPATKPPKIIKRRDNPAAELSENTPRRCLHCASEKTPQWRTGPMGPKTLCNACGVRYKSGRLVPEYRPAASPTFVSAKHSNSHRKVLELRRQMEVFRAQQHHQFLSQTPIFTKSNGVDEFLMNRYNAPSFSQMI